MPCVSVRVFSQLVVVVGILATQGEWLLTDAESGLAMIHLRMPTRLGLDKSADPARHATV